MDEPQLDDLEFEVLPAWQKAFNSLFYPFLNYVVPAWLARWFIGISKSDLLKEFMKRPGGWRMMRLVYDDDPPKDCIDALAKRSRLSRATRNRKKLFVRLLAHLLQLHKDENPLEVVGVGTGPGTNILEAIAQAKLDNVKVYCIDFDSDAFEYGRELAEQWGVADKVEYIQGDAREIALHVAGSPCLAKVIGLIEYLTDQQVEEMFRVLFDALKPGGHIFVSEISNKHGVARFSERVMGWHVTYRSTEEIIAMLEGTGFVSVKTYAEPLQVFKALIAEKPALT